MGMSLSDYSRTNCTAHTVDLSMPAEHVRSIVEGETWTKNP